LPSTSEIKLSLLITDPNIYSQTVNIGPDEEFITINKLYNILSNKLKFNLEPVYLEDRPNEVKHATCSAEKARTLLNYKTKVNLSDSLDKLISFIKEKGPKKFEYNYDIEINNNLTPLSWKEKIF
jgi:UDP-glucose 4-epimerase